MNKEIQVIEDYTCDARKQREKNTKQRGFDSGCSSVRNGSLVLDEGPRRSFIIA